MTLSMSSIMLSMSIVDWIVVFTYLGCVMAVGRYFARRQHNSQDFFVGGRRMPWLAVALSVVASLASTVGYLGDPGEVIQHGIGFLIRLAAIPLALWFTIAFIVPYFQKAECTTAFELLGQRFGRRMQLFGVVVWAYMQVAFLGLVLLLASRLIAQIIDIPNVWVILVIGTASLLYTSAGGIQSVIWTDVVQFVILASGAVVTLVVVAIETQTGPGVWWAEVSGATHELPPIFSWDFTERHTWVGAIFFGFVVNICYNASDQVVVQRYFATPRARLMMVASYVAGAAFTILTLAVGAALLSYYQTVPNALPSGVEEVMSEEFADKAFPHFIATALPMGLTGLVIAALLGAAQSTLDSGVNSLAAVLLNDVLAPAKRTAEENLQTARRMTRYVGAGVIAMAMLVDNLPGTNNIVDTAQKVVHLGLGPLGGLFLVAMFFPTASRTAAHAALWSGLVAAVFFAFARQLSGREVLSPLLIIPVSWLVTLVAAAAITFVSPDRHSGGM